MGPKKGYSWLMRLVFLVLFLPTVVLFLLHLLGVGSDGEEDFPRGLHKHSHDVNPEDCEDCAFDAHHHEPVYLPPESETRFPIVVWWTPFVALPRAEHNCLEGTCLFTHSRTEQENPNTSAFMFYGTDLDWYDLPLPRQRHVMWAVLHEESPKNNWVLAHEKAMNLFNLTATCSRHSNYPLTTQYLYNMDLLVRPPLVETAEKGKGDLGLVVYIQSDCDPPSDRDSYVEELMKYVQVDSYGDCLHNKDLPDHLVDSLTFDAEDLYKIVAQYKFAIAFENAVCHDYITEKFWRPLYVGAVPVVRGSPTTQDWAPDIEHSIIMADDFDSPRELAEYLKFLDQNTAEYEKYLKFKRTGITNPMLLKHMEEREWRVDYDEPGLHFVEGFECFVCNEIHRNKRMKEQGEELMSTVANHSHYDCPIPEPSLELRGNTLEEKMSQMRENGRNELTFWRHIAQCSEEKANTVFEEISAGRTQREVSEALERVLC